ncbi:MAG TPA: hypothetical protein VG838_12285 [Opitutaceae bacterium]|nr:hypothetical protein [Opitutaceae bacterium]
MSARPLSVFAVLLGLTMARGGAEVPAIPEAEAFAPPTPARLAALVAAGEGGDWAGVDAAARAAAFAAYRADRLAAAEGWYYVHRWAGLFSETEAVFVMNWIQAVTAAKVGHANMARSYAGSDRRLGEMLSPGLRAWLAGNEAFSAEFFAVLASVDYLPRVFAQLDEIYRADPVRFREYPSLALAIAVVYDVPPPPDWPHAQVSATVLPRRWPGALEAFDWWVREDRAGHTYQHLARLGADELKFLVDAAAPLAELEWSQKAVEYPPGDLPLAYTMIRYRMDRLQAQKLNWPGRTYRLYDILQEGGICVDQAYFASEAGKARGVPTLLFLGAGLDGRHAWFGYLDGMQRWQLDAGRYAEQRFITGTAYDPQTWQVLTDHEVKFLSERFHALPSYHQSRVQAVFAEEFLRDHRPADAVAAARKAVNYERRNLGAWELLLAAQQAQEAKPAALESTLREASQAFQRYPDLEIGFSNRLVANLRGRGEKSLADFEETRLARKYQAERSDLSIQQAVGTLQRSFATQSPAEQVRAYDSVVDNFGHGGGMEFFDKVVVVFAEHLLQLGDRAGALRAVDYARAALNVEPGRQLDQELTALSARLKKGGAR